MNIKLLNVRFVKGIIPKDNKWREDISNIFYLRNGLVHGQRKHVSKNDIEKALSKVDEVPKIFEDY